MSHDTNTIFMGKVFNQSRTYKPTQVIHKLSKDYGIELCANAIRKYDYQVLSTLLASRTRNERRNYSEQEVIYFGKVAVLRMLGYSLKETKDIMEQQIVGKVDNSIAILNQLERHIQGIRKLFNS